MWLLIYGGYIEGMNKNINVCMFICIYMYLFNNVLQLMLLSVFIYKGNVRKFRISNFII